MRTSPRIISIFLNLALLGSIGSEAAAFGQEQIELAVPKDDPVKNAIPVSSIAFSPDGNLVATSHGMNLGMLQEPRPGQTILWDPRTGKRVKTIPALKEGVHWAAFSPDGKTLAVMEFTGIIRLIAVPDGGELRKFEVKEEGPVFYSFAFFPNGERLAAGIAAPRGGPNDIAIFDLASGKQILTLDDHDGVVTSVAVSPNGKLLASGAFDGTARVWDALTGKPLGTVKFPSLIKKLEDKDFEDLIWVQSVAFSPDSRTLVAAASYQFESAAVEVWDISTAKSRATLNDIDPEVRQVVFSPDGKRLMTVGKEIKVWDTATFKASGAIEGGCWPIALSPDGKVIAATVDIRTVVIQETQKLNAFRR